MKKFIIGIFLIFIAAHIFNYLYLREEMRPPKVEDIVKTFPNQVPHTDAHRSKAEPPTKNSKIKKANTTRRRLYKGRSEKEWQFYVSNVRGGNRNHQEYITLIRTKECADAGVSRCKKDLVQAEKRWWAPRCYKVESSFGFYMGRKHKEQDFSHEERLGESSYFLQLEPFVSDQDFQEVILLDDAANKKMIEIEINDRATERMAELTRIHKKQYLCLAMKDHLFSCIQIHGEIKSRRLTFSLAKGEKSGEDRTSAFFDKLCESPETRALPY